MSVWPPDCVLPATPQDPYPSSRPHQLQAEQTPWVWAGLEMTASHLGYQTDLQTRCSVKPSSLLTTQTLETETRGGKSTDTWEDARGMGGH